tara:strand:+ start:9934 stop:10134 length:201 start_codon:yes stop_codon:yes gene_type:complete
MKRLSYNNWMKYIYNSLNPKTKQECKFGQVGNRSEIDIQDEIEYLRNLDTEISNKVRSSYTIKNEN